jgi:hypothetical protein
MAFTPSYHVYIIERSELQPIKAGSDYPSDPMDAYWSGEAESPELAIEDGGAEWRRKYDADPPIDVEVKVELGPGVCPHCQGRGWVPGDTYGLADPGEHALLDATARRTCRACLGTRNETQP